MLTRRQAVFIGLWVASPFILLIVLMLLNPVYESKLFENFGGFYGIEFLLLLQAANAFILYRSFRMSNRAALTADGRPPRRVRIVSLLLLVIVLLLTLAAFWVVILYPAVLILLQQPRSF